MPKIDKNDNSSGLTLIEVLISMAVLMIGIFAVMSMLSTAAKGNAEARKMTRALNIAEDKMEEFLYGEKDCSELEGSQGIYQWSPEYDPSPPEGTEHCKITVTWTSYGENRIVSLETLRSSN